MGAKYTPSRALKRNFSASMRKSVATLPVHVSPREIWLPAKGAITVVTTVATPEILIATDTAKLRTPHRQMLQLTQTAMQIQHVIIVERKDI